MSKLIDLVNNKISDDKTGDALSILVQKGAIGASEKVKAFYKTIEKWEQHENKLIATKSKWNMSDYDKYRDEIREISTYCQNVAMSYDRQESK